MSNTKLQKELIERLQVICDDLGLVLGICEGTEVGVIIGTEAYIQTVAEIVGQEEYSVEQDYEDALEEVLLPRGNKNDSNLH